MRGTSLHRRLLEAHELSREQYADAFSLARTIEADAVSAGDEAAEIRAIVLQGKMQVMRGWMDEACATAARLAVVRSEECADPYAGCAVGAFHARLEFFLGAYRDALFAARAAIARADAHGDPALRLAVINETFLVLGHLGAPGTDEIQNERSRLARELRDHWQQALGHNDRATLLVYGGRLDEAIIEMGRARSAAALVEGPAHCLSAVLSATQAEVLIAENRPDEGLRLAIEARRQLALLNAPNPYLLSSIAIIVVQAHATAGRLDDAVAEARSCMDQLGRYLPMMRSALMQNIAEPLKAAARFEEAYEALAQSVTIEREATRQFSALQYDLNHALRDHDAARLEAERLRHEADCDPLTGLRNRRAMASVRLGELDDVDSVGVVLVDVDHFKQVNDRHGHDVGDRVLVRIAQIMLSVARSDDLLMRMGGDEFVVVMFGATRPAARAFADRLQSALVAEDWAAIAWTLEVGVSIGVTAGGTDRSLPDLIASADGKMYLAKEAGRGQVAGGESESTGAIAEPGAPA